LKRPNRHKVFTKTLLVDGDSLIKTAYYGAKNLYSNGIHIGGIFQFLTMLRKMLNENRFDFGMVNLVVDLDMTYIKNISQIETKISMLNNHLPN
jgi:hypothetical protein